jgi:hypothetical protein
MTDPNDDIDELLAPRPAAPHPALRDAILLHTESVLARMRWLHRVVNVAAVAAVLAIGIGVGWVLKPERERVVEVAGAERVVPVLIPVFLTVDTANARPPVSPDVPLSATAAELRAEQADDVAEAAKLYRAAGDRFLDQEDYRNATRCYRLFLARAGDEALSPEKGDSWLLTSLKNAAYKEKTDVPPIRD